MSKTKNMVEKQSNIDREYKFNFIGKGKIFYIASLIIIITGIVFYFLRGFNFGIDFLGFSILNVLNVFVFN